MSIPTITAIAPTSGHTGGRTIVEIDGTGFRLPTAQAPVAGVVPEPPASVAVTFGGVPALEVRVVSSALLYVIAPIHDPGPVDVVVQNVDDTGAPIPGELATSVSGYSFQLPDLTEESDLARCIRTFILELQRQVVANVKWPAHTDYDDTTGDLLSISEVATFPALILADVNVPENAFFSLREPTEIQVDEATFVALAPPTTVDIEVTIVGVSDSSVELLNLLAATRRFFRKNPYLTMARDPADANKGAVQYEMDWHSQPDAKLTLTSSKSNVRHFAGTVTIRGFDIEAFAGLELGGPGEASEGIVDVGKSADTVLLEPSLKQAIE